MAEKDNTNGIADPDVNIWAEILSASVILRANIKNVVFSGIITMLGFSLMYESDATWGKHGSYLVLMSTVILGAILGYRAHGKDSVRPFESVFGVAWRIGAVWVVLAVLAEYLVPECVLTVKTVPFQFLSAIFFSSMLCVGVPYLLAYLLAYLLDVVRPERLSVNTVLQVLALLIGVIPLVFQVIILNRNLHVEYNRKPDVLSASVVESNIISQYQKFITDLPTSTEKLDIDLVNRDKYAKAIIDGNGEDKWVTTDGDTIKKKDTFYADKPDWVKVVFKGEESCLIKPRGALEILGFSNDMNAALIRYKAPEDSTWMACKTGTYFFYPVPK